MPNTQKILMEDQSRKRLDWALQRLLHALKPFMRAYARTPDEQAKVSGLDLAWVTDLDGGPGKAILDVLKANPELWLQALPDEVCIVSRKELEIVAGKLCPDVVSYLSMAGESIIATQAAKHSHEMAGR